MKNKLRRCGRCKANRIEKTGFYRNRSQPDGIDGYCKECRNAASKKWSSTPERKARHRMLSAINMRAKRGARKKAA